MAYRLLICAMLAVPVPVREYKKDNAALVELSRDGKLMLTKGERRKDCKSRPGKCRSEVLAVYDTRTGKLLGEHVSAEEATFDAAAFESERSVIAGRIRWDFRSGAVSEAPNPQPHDPVRPCREFTGERLHGFTISPDGTLAAAVTGVGELPPGSPGYRVILHVLSSADCAEQRKMELEFPEKPRWKSPLLAPKTKYLDNVPFASQFAKYLAISSDNKMLAMAYGVFRDPHGYAYFGLYSLADGRRLATLAGDVYHCGILYGGLMQDSLECAAAPIAGPLQFSPDSQMLFATSKHVHQWDVSAIR